LHCRAYPDLRHFEQETVMRHAGWLAVGWMLVTGSLRADWKITTVTSNMRGEESVRTEYYKGKLERSDVELDGKVVAVWVMDRENARQTAWDPHTRQYSVTSYTRAPQPAVPVAAEADAGLRPVMHFDSVTTDTGEQKVFFGHTARHFITTEKRTTENAGDGGRELDSETVMDAWYIDDVLQPGKAGTRLITYGAMLSAGRPPVIKFTHSGPAVSGMVVQETTDTKFVSARGVRASYKNSTEVKELSDAVLPQQLFEPPAGYTRVAQLANPYVARHATLSDEIETYWNSFESWLVSWLF
jgi:hypothetical protein